MFVFEQVSGAFKRFSPSLVKNVLSDFVLRFGHENSFQAVFSVL